MKVFNVSRRYVNGVEQFESCNLNLSSNDVRIVVEALEKAKFTDAFEAEQRVVVLTALKPFIK